MNFEDKLDKKIGRDPGFRVPDGYFEAAFERIASELPPVAAPAAREKLTVWHRVRPYLYMAAMFAGIWLMMKVFYTMSHRSDSISLDNPPTAIAQVMSVYVPSDGIYESSIYDESLEEDVSEYYTNIEDFESDFGYTIKPEYAEI